MNTPVNMEPKTKKREVERSIAASGKTAAPEHKPKKLEKIG